MEFLGRRAEYKANVRTENRCMNSRSANKLAGLAA